MSTILAGTPNQVCRCGHHKRSPEDNLHPGTWQALCIFCRHSLQRPIICPCDGCRVKYLESPIRTYGSTFLYGNRKWTEIKIKPRMTSAQHTAWMKIEPDVKWIDNLTLPGPAANDRMIVGQALVAISLSARQVKNALEQFDSLAILDAEDHDSWDQELIKMFIVSVCMHFFKIWTPAFEDVKMCLAGQAELRGIRGDSPKNEKAKIKEKQKAARIRAAARPWPMDWKFEIRGRNRNKGRADGLSEPVTKDGKCATMEDLRKDTEESLKDLENALDLFRKDCVAAGAYEFPDGDVSLIPTRSLQDVLLEIALRKNNKKPKMDDLSGLKDVVAHLGLTFLTLAKSGIVVDEKHFSTQSVPEMYFVCAQSERGWIVGATQPTCGKWHRPAHIIFEKLKAHEIGEGFIDVYTRVQRELIDLEELLWNEAEAAEEESIGVRALTFLQKDEMLLQVREATIEQFRKSDFFLSRVKSKGQATYRTGMPKPMCYRCRATFAFDEQADLDEADIKNNMVSYMWPQRYEKPASCAETCVALQCAQFEYLNYRAPWDNKCDPARWPPYVEQTDHVKLKRLRERSSVQKEAKSNRGSFAYGLDSEDRVVLAPAFVAAACASVGYVVLRMISVGPMWRAV